MSSNSGNRPPRRAIIRAAPFLGAALASLGRTSTAHAAPRGPAALRLNPNADPRKPIDAALQRVLKAGEGRHVVLSAGRFVVETRIDIPPHTNLELEGGVTLTSRLASGESSFVLGDGARLYSFGAAQVVAGSKCKIKSLIANQAKDGSQEYAYVDGLYVMSESNAQIADALISFTAVFVNSGIRNCVIASNNTAPHAIKISGGAKTGFGPVYIDNVWVTGSTGHNIVIEEMSPPRGSASLWLTNITSEHQASGSHGLYLKGSGGLYNVHVRNFHYENNKIATALTAAIWVDGVPGFYLDGADILSAPTKNKAGVVITKNFLNSRTRIVGVQNINGIDPIVEDRQYGKALGANNVALYETADPAANAVQCYVHPVQMLGGISTLTAAGTITDATFAANKTVADGTLAVDTVNERLYVRVNGKWKWTKLH